MEFFRGTHYKSLELHMKQEDKEFIELLSDRDIVDAILRRDARVTRIYFYEKYYPLFKARFDEYYTDCETCIEFINQIYSYIMINRPKTGKCYLASFNFDCSLGYWLDIIVKNYCHQLFKKRSSRIIKVNIDTDRNIGGITTINFDALNKRDVDRMLNRMRNKRYRDIICFRYIEGRSNEETAVILGMSMDNYYNKHKIAKQQFTNILKEEGLL